MIRDEDAIDVLGRPLARTDAGDVAAELLHVVGDVGRVEGDRGVEVAEEDDEGDVRRGCRATVARRQRACDPLRAPGGR